MATPASPARLSPAARALPDFSTREAREAPPLDRPRPSRPIPVPLVVAQRTLVLFGMDEALACMNDLKAMVDSGETIGMGELLALEARLSTTRTLVSGGSTAHSAPA